MNKANIGLVGLAVMGENLVMNMESKGFTVAVYTVQLKKLRTSLKEEQRARTSSAATPLKNLRRACKSLVKS